MRHGKAYAHEMTDDDHRGLAAALCEVDGMVIVSGYPSELYTELYAGWQVIEFPALADGARNRTEVIWLSPNINSTPIFNFEPAPAQGQE